uniref:ABC transporter domain-containing protein n=1 Tax=Glossina austeni TaxID=7395 RepID=A0A1A9V1P9_GLOAU
MESTKIFWLFIYKQFMDLRFNWKSTGFLLLSIILAQYLIIYFAYQPFEPLTVFYSPQEPETLHEGCLFDSGIVHSQTFYSPNTTEVNSFITKICGVNKHIKRFSHPQVMVKHIEECTEYCMGIYFHKFISTGPLKYTIYTNRMKLKTEQRYVTDNLGSSYSQSRDYKDFLKLQHSIDMAFTQQISDGQNTIKVRVDSMPFMRGGYFHNEAGLIFGYAFPICTIALMIITFIVPLVEEKRDGIKEFLAIATPLSYLNGLAFYIIRLMLYMIYADCVLVVATLYNALGVIPVIYVFLLVLLFTLSMMSFSYLISVFFNEVFHAKVCSFFLHCVPFTFLQIPNKVGVYLFSFNAFYEAWEVFQIFGNKCASFNFADLFVHITETRFSICQVYVILIVQSIMYALLYQYFAAIYPGIGGIRKPYLFFLKSKFWRNVNTNDYVTTDSGCDAIIIQDLQKEFQTRGRKILIADRLNMVIKNKQITVLLGHNGAGKTTTINMIMGLVQKDKGKITVCSERDASSYRHLIGYCPQHSIHMPYMTCRQHLIFFAKLRGLTHCEAAILANKLLQQLNLSKKAHGYGKNLSGGMKRRLSLGIAMAGETKVIVLDEPSSGLDIESRRELWDVLLDLRKTKAIMITTHHMEEAEVLGDTISILCNGRVLLTGAPLELKRKVGSGYILKLCTNPSQFNKDECLQFIRVDIPTANVMEIVPPTILLSLPYQHRENYGKMLRRLEKYQQELGITTISMTDTTLEDVFLHSTSKVDEIDGAVNCHADTNSSIPYHRLDSMNSVSSFQQLKALAYKKTLFVKNEWRLASLMISIPFLLTTVAILIIHMSIVTTFGKGLDLSLSHYNDGIIFINIPQDPHESILRISQLLHQRIIFNDHLQVKNLVLNGSNNVEEELIGMMKKDFFTFQREVIGCVKIDGGKSPAITILFSENMIHSSAILLNLVDNVINMWTKDVNQTTLKTIYAPVAIHDSSAASLQLSYYALLVPAGMFMLMFYFAMLPFMENRNGFKLLQPTSTTAYWFDVLIIDSLLFLGICFLLFGYQVLIMPHELYEISDLINIISALFFYGLSYLPLVYSFANLFTALSTLSSCMSALFFVSFIPTIVLSTSVGDMIKYSNFILLLRFMPDFNLAHQFRIINERFVNNHEESVPQSVRLELNNKRVLKLGNFYYYALIVFSLLMSFFVLVVENKKRRYAIENLLKFSKVTKKSDQCSTPDQEEDRLVQEEKSIVDQILKDNSEHEYPLFVQNLYKYYTELPAVCGLNFVVRKKECFGLLGVNGAGKTTTFEMIAANRILSAGIIKIDGVDISQETEYRHRFGYCPQNDCLNNFMTAYQILKYMAFLRGIEVPHVRHAVMYWLEKLDLLNYKDVQVKYYSGGTKRKLQTAVAMIGSPSLVLLDEPTTGVDPASRRFLWQCMQDFQKRDKTIVLTSHSMDECEHLCNRLAIMADGRIKCLGYVPELKQLHAAGFTISFKLVSGDVSDEDIQFITRELRSQFSKCNLRENHAGILTYFVKAKDSIIWSQVFLKSEQFFRAFSHLIEEYSVNESTLEDIFLTCGTRSHRNECVNDDYNYRTSETMTTSQIEDV